MWSAYVAPHTLFRLVPCLEILYPDHDAWITDLVSTIGTDKYQERKGGLNFGEPSSTGLSIDFDTKTATMRSRPTEMHNPFISETEIEKQCESPSNRYYDIGREHNISTGAWETSMRIQKFEMFAVGGKWSKPLDSVEYTNHKYELPSRFQKEDSRDKWLGGKVERRAVAGTTARMQEPKVSDEVLKKRIQGFGHDSDNGQASLSRQ